MDPNHIQRQELRCEDTSRKAGHPKDFNREQREQLKLPSANNSQQPSSNKADVSLLQWDKYDLTQEEGVFYLEDDNVDNSSANRDDEPTKFINTDYSYNASSRSDRDKETEEIRSIDWDAKYSHRTKDVLDITADISPIQSVQSEEAIAGTHHQTSSVVSSPRGVPTVHRSNSSPLSAVCRPSHCHLVMVRCQVNCHDIPHLSSSCPAAFSPVWTRLVQPLPSSSHGKGGYEKRRRHTVAGPAASAQLRHLQHQHQHHHGVTSHLHRGSLDGRRSDNTHPDPNKLTLEGQGQGLGRSLSDSELQHLLMKEVGQVLRRLSDEFHFIKTGKKLTTVAESAVSEDDSDDEM